ncbi:hypothetical protein CISIN_1g047010mg, partial [Citrus sinensis]
CYCNKNDFFEARKVIDYMFDNGYHPNVTTYTILEAYEMLMNVKNDGLKPDVYTYTAVMDGFCKVGRSNEVMELLNEAIERGVTPNVVTLIHLHNVIDIGHIPRTITFNNVIQALCGVGKIDKALLLLFLMYEHGKIPSRTLYDTLIKKLDQQP